jgi:hypothetical protein
MTDKVQDPSSNTGIEVQGEALTPVQEEALQQGWVPKAEFDGDVERWVDAGEFLRRGELFRKIESQSKEIKETKRALAELAKHNAKIREVEYARAVEALKVQKKTALAEGDADRVVEIDDKLDLVKDQQRQFANQQVAQPIPQEVHPELQNWISNNSWYENNKAMRGWADARGLELAEEGKSPREVLKALQVEVKDRFKEKFSNPNRERAGAVEGVRGRPSTKSDSDYELTDTERTIMNTLVNQKVLTKEEYIAQLKAVKEKQ